MHHEVKQDSDVHSTVNAHYDAIVIGAGYPGLIAGAILSRNGLKTVVLDELDQIGERFGNTFMNGYWLDWGHRDAREIYSDNYLVMTRPNEFGKKAAEAAGAQISLVGPILPTVKVHRTNGKIVAFTGDEQSFVEFCTGVLDLPPEKVKSFAGLMGALGQEDEQKYMNLTMGEWLAGKADSDVHNAFARVAQIHYARPVEGNSVGRWIHSIKNPVDIYKVNDPEVGGLQGVHEAYARVIRKHGGEISLGLQPVEITLKNGKVAGVVARDKSQTVREYHAPVVVFTLPFWEVFEVVDEGLFPAGVVENAKLVKKWYTRGDMAGLNIGVSRLPTIRATGKTEDYMGWNQFTEHLADGWYVPTLSSAKQAPPGKHMINILAGTHDTFGSWEKVKARLHAVKDYMNRYYSDLEAITEWENYQWLRIWGTSAYWGPVTKGPLQVPGLDGLFFAGATVEAAGQFEDIEANSALQVTKLILQRCIRR